MKRGLIFVCLLVFTLSLSIVSAGFFSDLWGKITGKPISYSPEDDLRDLEIRGLEIESAVAVSNQTCINDSNCPPTTTKYCDGNNLITSTTYYSCISEECVIMGRSSGASPCPNGCQDGACIEGNQTQNQTCTDTDGGINYYEGGTCTFSSPSGGGGGAVDTCLNSTILIECYCDIDNELIATNFTCPDGCDIDARACVERNETECGNGICESGEDEFSCPQDCSGPIFSLNMTLLEFEDPDVFVGQPTTIIKRVQNIGNIGFYITSFSNFDFPPYGNASGGSGPVAPEVYLNYSSPPSQHTFYEERTFDKVGWWTIKRCYYGRGDYNATETYFDDNCLNKTFYVGGGFDSVKFEKASNKLNLGENIWYVFTGSITDSDFPNFLKDSSVDFYNYEQRIKGNGNITLQYFSDADYDNGEWTLGFHVRSNENMLNYTLDFALDVPFDFLLGKQVYFLGKSYYIFDYSTSPTGLKLLGPATSAEVREGETVTMVVGEQIYDVSIAYINYDGIKLIINGEYVPNGGKLQEGGTYKLVDGNYVAITEILISGTLSRVVFAIGENFLELSHDSNLRLNSEYLPGVETYLFVWNGNLDKIDIEWRNDDELFITEENSEYLPGFETLRFRFEGMNWEGDEYVGHAYLDAFYEEEISPQVQCGDANSDGNINILDATFLIRYLYKDGPAPLSTWAANVNGDHALNILDINYLINYLYKGGDELDCDYISNRTASEDPTKDWSYGKTKSYLKNAQKSYENKITKKSVWAQIRGWFKKSF